MTTNSDLDEIFRKVREKNKKLGWSKEKKQLEEKNVLRKLKPSKSTKDILKKLVKQYEETKYSQEQEQANKDFTERIKREDKVIEEKKEGILSKLGYRKKTTPTQRKARLGTLKKLGSFARKTISVENPEVRGKPVRFGKVSYDSLVPANEIQADRGRILPWNNNKQTVDLVTGKPKKTRWI